MTGSEKILREKIFEPSTSYSLGLNDRWKISTAATQIQRKGRTLRMDQFDAHFPMGTRGSSKKRDEDRIWQQINTFLVVISKIKPELHRLDMQKYKHIKII